MRSLEAGHAIGRAFALIQRFPLQVFGVALLAGAVPTRALYYGISLQQARGLPDFAGTFEGIFVSLLLQTIVAGLLVSSAISGEPGLGTGPRRLPRLFLAGLLNAIGSIVAMICLLFPYFFLLTRWSVVGAVTASEDIGISTAFGRSSELTEGARLRIFGLLITSGVCQMLLLVLGMVVLIPVTGATAATQDFSWQPAAFAMRLVLETLMFALSGALQCALYVALRERRDGPFADRLSEIFA